MSDKNRPSGKSPRGAIEQAVEAVARNIQARDDLTRSLTHNLEARPVTASPLEISVASLGTATQPIPPARAFAPEATAMNGSVEANRPSRVRQAPTWPQGLSNRRAVERLRSMMVNVAEGQRSISDDRQYQTLRTIYMRQRRLTAVGPELVKTHPTLNSLAAYFRANSDRKARVVEIMDDFSPLMELLTPSKAEGHESSAWTGREDIAQQARGVRTMSVAIVRALDVLIEDEERRHHNGGPVEPAEEAALDALKQLRDALNDLISSIEAELPWQPKLQKLKQLGQTAGSIVMAEIISVGKTVPPVASTTAITALVALICHWFGSGETLTAGIAATSGGSVITARALNSKNTRK
ncbi:hypothetical protein H9L12_06025 [Sphingomonas rhizophila]|uniref:Uncharacterized protein n=1 Tax=Sphingomonas rhizophila TaxID=2071607 RepID=A0A7G9SDX0_9SPHN|nr:hypothetical protein [Sphingomonas rhizophila]QNN66045.1 hypothetical protein H9L12_06025 [Sphingomonas rhizophila]